MERWEGIERPYAEEDVERLRGSVQVEHTLARLGAERLWELLQEEPYVAAADLLDVRVREGEITDEGVRANVSVGLRYLESWLRGTGAAAIDNLMEDAATAEISRSQI